MAKLTNTQLIRLSTAAQRDEIASVVTARMNLAFAIAQEADDELSSIYRIVGEQKPAAA